jgi:hypothetical protein
MIQLIHHALHRFFAYDARLCHFLHRVLRFTFPVLAAPHFAKAAPPKRVLQLKLRF